MRADAYDGIVAYSQTDFTEDASVGAGLPAMAVCQAMEMLAVPASSLASQLLQIVGCCREWRLAVNPVAMAVGQAMEMLAAPSSSLASQLLQFVGRCREWRLAVIPCRSRLAGDGGVSGDGDVGCAGLIAGKPAPTVCWVLPGMASGGDPQ
jgi:hypothetical protein